MHSIRYFFKTPPLQGKRLSIHGLGIQEPMPPCLVNRASGLGDYLFMVFYDAVEVGAVDGRLLRPAGTLIIWPPGEGHYYGRTDGKWHHSWTHCDGTQVAAYLRENHIPCNTAIRLPAPAMADKYLFDIHTELSTHARPDAVVVGNCLENWIREIARVVRGQFEPPVPGEYLELKAYLDGHYHQALRLEVLARRAGLSIPHLCSQFRRYFGIPVMAYVLELRLRQAAALLQDTALSVTQVASAVGYNDLYHFSKSIKQHYGVSPRQMRRAAQGIGS